jgi:3-dehydroquinate dehydratase/shikimate dehydrogenase
MGKVCVAIIGSTAGEMVDRATEALRDSPFLEFRLDYLEKPLAALPKLKEFLAEKSVVTAVATCRRAANGGKFKGTIAAELEVLQKATASGFHLLDLELQTAEAIKAPDLEKLRSPRRGPHGLVPRFSDDQGSGWHLRTHPALRTGIYQRSCPRPSRSPTTW